MNTCLFQYPGYNKCYGYDCEENLTAGEIYAVQIEQPDGAIVCETLRFVGYDEKPCYARKKASAKKANSKQKHYFEHTEEIKNKRRGL